MKRMNVDYSNILYTFGLNEGKWTTLDDDDDDNVDDDDGINESIGTLFIILPARNVIDAQCRVDDREERL
jgi:hypothetical protein